MEALTMIQDGMADLGILPDPEFSAQFDYMHLFEVPVALVVPLDHPLGRLKASAIQADQILEYPLVLPRKGLAARASLDNCLGSSPDDYHPGIEVGNVALMARLVRLGAGIGIGPCFKSMIEENPGVIFKPLNHMFPSQRVGVVKRRGVVMNRALDGFIDLLGRTLSETSH